MADQAPAPQPQPQPLRFEVEPNSGTRIVAHMPDGTKYDLTIQLAPYVVAFKGSHSLTADGLMPDINVEAQFVVKIRPHTPPAPSTAPTPAAGPPPTAN